MAIIARMIDCADAWNLIEDIKAQMDRVRYLSLTDVTPLSSLIGQHSEVLQALEQHDSCRARQAMRGHLQEIIRSLAPIQDRHPEWFAEE